MRNRLIPLIPTLDALLKELTSVKDSVEKGRISIQEHGYFNILVIIERIKEAKERLEAMNPGH